MDVILIIRVLCPTKLKNRKKYQYPLLTMSRILQNFLGMHCDGYLGCPYLRLPNRLLYSSISK